MAARAALTALLTALTLWAPLAQADDVAQAMAQALKAHKTSVVRLEATALLRVAGLPGVPRDARRTYRISVPGVVVDPNGLVIAPAKALDPAGDVFGLLSGDAQPQLLSVRVVGADGGVREAEWLGRSQATGLVFVRVGPVGRAGLEPVKFVKASPGVGAPLYVVSQGSPARGRPATVELARVAADTEGPVPLTPLLPHALGGLICNQRGQAIGLLGTAPLPEREARQASVLRPDLLAEARRPYLVPAATLLPALSKPPQGAAGGRRRARPWLGIEPQVVTPELAEAEGLKLDYGVRVERIYADSPAAKGGLQGGDVIFELDGEPIELDPDERLADWISDYRVGETVELRVRRGDKAQTVEVELEAGPVRPRRAERAPITKAGLLVRALTFFDRQELALPETQGGCIVLQIAPDGPASRAGLRPGDVIVSVDGKPLGGVADAKERLGGDGERTLGLKRRGKDLTLKLR